MENIGDKHQDDLDLSLEEMQAVLESSYDGILVTDARGNVLIVNTAYLRMTGLPGDEIIGRNMQEFIQEGYMEKSAALMALKEKKHVTITHHDVPGGTIIVTASPVFDEKHRLKRVITNVRDMTEIFRLREELDKAREMEELYYKHFENRRGHVNGPIAVSNKMIEVFTTALKVSSVDVTVLILGESGVGKEVVAQYIHSNSPRKNKPLITVNCGAIPETLLESELFGYEGGAFTGAARGGKAGLFEAAQGSTLFLDEIGELPLNLQVKLLRVLENRQINRIGSTVPTSVDVRILAATNRDLETMVEKEEFRDDLYYRLNVIQITLPPLRERTEDIAPLSMHFLNEFNQRYKQQKRMSYDVLKELEKYNWNGNIRELKNTIERLVVMSNTDYLEVGCLPCRKKQEKDEGTSPVCVHRLLPINQAVEETEKQVLNLARQENKSSREIARVLGIDQTTVLRKMKKYGMQV